MKRQFASQLSIGNLHRSLLFKVVAILSLVTFPASWGPWQLLLYANDTVVAENTTEALLRAAEVFVDEMDQRTFNVESLAKELGNDPGVILNWMRENTRYVPYEGVLKGANGTLMARQGNSIDRVLLLQELLAYHLIESRILHTQLSEKTGLELAQVRFDSADTSLPEQAEWLTDSKIRKISDRLGADEGLFRENLASERKRNSDFDESLVEITEKQVGVLFGKLKNTPNGDTVINPSKDHFWIQFKDKSGQWNDLCLDFGDAIPPDIMEGNTIEYYSNVTELPDEWLHQMLVRVWLEKQTGDEVQVESCLEYTFSALEYGNRQISWGFKGVHTMSPKQMAEIAKNDPIGAIEAHRETILNENEWIPYFKIQGVDSPVVNMRFDDKGNLSHATQSPEAKLGQTIGGLMGGAFGGFDGGRPVETSILTAVKIEYVFISPGVEPHREWRPVFQIENDENNEGSIRDEARIRRAMALTRNVDLFLQQGKITPLWSEWSTANSFHQAGLAFNYLKKSHERNPEDSAMIEAFAKVSGRMEQINLGLIDLASKRLLGEQVYLPVLNVLGSVQQSKYDLGNDEQGIMILSLDIVRNKVASIAHGLEHQFLDVFRTGIADTNLESMYLNGPNLKTLSVNAAKAFEIGSSKNWKFIEDGSSSISGMAGEAIQSDLDQGYLVLANEETGFSQWWRIQTETGEILGMARSEVGIGGQTAAEYIKLVGFVVALGFGFEAALSCIDGGGGFGCVLCFALVFVTAYIALAVSLLGAPGLAAAGAATAAEVAGLAAGVFAGVCGIALR